MDQEREQPTGLVGASLNPRTSGNSVTPSRPKQVDNELSILQDAINALDREIELLANRLSPVLSNDNSDIGGGEKNVVEESIAVIPDILRANRKTVVRNVRLVQNLIVRLEI